ncbi:MAG: type I methionyl aminopeptidase [Candidatus Caenarcaniphilales bacterium]|nr:type I methionyl aminopeptidase [Candidatus Caenarcaniphilales bacterium]
MNNIFIYKKQEEHKLFRKAARMSATILQEVCDRAEPGMSTWDLDIFAEEWIRDNGAVPTFKGYMGFPCTLCTSINQEIVHGIPSEKRVLKEGDILSVDVGVTLKSEIEGKETNFVGDNAKTIPIGKVPDKTIKLIADTKHGLEEGVKKCIPGNKISDIAAAVEKVAISEGYGLVKEFGGHGIGPNYHCAPFIPNFSSYFKAFDDCVIEEGMILAIEPMFNLGLGDIRKMKDGWTIVTKDNKLSAHYEYSVLVTDSGPEIITIPEDWSKL